MHLARWLALAGLALTAPVALGAQAGNRPPQPAETWSLDTLRSGYCIHFLADPATVANGIFRGAQPLPASATEALNPALRRAIQDSPEFAAWIPSQFCSYQFAAVRMGDTELRDRKHGRPQTLAVWSIASPAEAPRSAVLLVNNSRLSMSVRWLGIGIDVLRSEFGKVPESSEDRYVIKYDRTTLTWDGHATGDSTGMAMRQRSWRVPARNGQLAIVRLRLGPSGSRAMAGSLRIEGKGELARMLMASPTRFVGPLVWGGSGDITFLP